MLVAVDHTQVVHSSRQAGDYHFLKILVHFVVTFNYHRTLHYRTGDEVRQKRPGRLMTSTDPRVDDADDPHTGNYHPIHI